MIVNPFFHPQITNAPPLVRLAPRELPPCIHPHAGVALSAAVKLPFAVAAQQSRLYQRRCERSRALPSLDSAKQAASSPPASPRDVSVYLGAAPIVECLERHTPDVLITSRVADASLFLGPMVFELGWNWDDLQLLAQGSLAGHLLECGCQLTGGYYMHPGDRHRKITFQNLLELSLPFVEVAFDGTVCVAKAEGTGGVLDSSICAEQLLYEIRDPSSYITPDLVKFAELTLDTFRMMQCLEWEPSGSFYQKPPVEPRENGVPADNSVTSGMIDINLLADMTDPNLPPNPKKAVLYRTSVTQLIAVIATVCEELPPESVMLIYLSTTGNSVHSNTSQVENNGLSRKSAMSSALSNIYHEQRNGFCDNHVTTMGDSNQYYENYLFLGPSRNGGRNTKNILIVILPCTISYYCQIAKFSAVVQSLLLNLYLKNYCC
ncbi:hypothetical protein ACS0TY_005088 [Phlomoides rotata]